MSANPRSWPSLPDLQRPSVPAPAMVQSIEPTRRTIDLEEALRRLDEKKKRTGPVSTLNKCEKEVVQNNDKIKSPGGKGLPSKSGASMSGRRVVSSINPMSRGTVFICRMKFWNELPDPTAQPKLIRSNMRNDRFTKYTNTSLEKQHRPELYAEPDLGIPLDLLDLSVYNRPEGVSLSLDPEDAKLLCEDDCATPVKKDGLKEKGRPDSSGINWLLKSEHRPSAAMPREKKSLKGKEVMETRGSSENPDELNRREGDSENSVRHDHAHEYEHIPMRQLAPTKKKSPKGNYKVKDHLPAPSGGTSGANEIVEHQSAREGTVMQDSGIIHSGGTDCNTTRPRRTRKKPAYLADYEC